VTLFLIAAGLLSLWIGSLYVHPFGRCWRCRGKRLIVRRKPRKAKPGKKPKMPRPVTCRVCKGIGRRQRGGSRTVHRLARRVSRELTRQRQQRATLTTPKE
jgi:hypothetical protein